MDAIEPAKDSDDLASSSLLKLFDSLGESSKDIFLRRLAEKLEERRRIALQKHLKPLINDGVEIDNLRFHYVIVNTYGHSPSIDGEFLRCYQHLDMHFGDRDMGSVVFAGKLTFDDGAVIDLTQTCLNQIVGANGGFDDVLTESPDLFPLVMAMARKKTIIPLSDSIVCFKIDPSGVWEKEMTDGTRVFKKHQNGALVGWVHDCIDICIESTYIRPIQGPLNMMSRGYTKYYMFDVDIDGQTRRVCYVDYDPTIYDPK